uniref:Uncharacterized protein n=1 Tax=Oryza nivara TaxID=4536 RepID=A0A0E0FR15_ORYNI
MPMGRWKRCGVEKGDSYSREAAAGKLSGERGWSRRQGVIGSSDAIAATSCHLGKRMSKQNVMNVEKELKVL